MVTREAVEQQLRAIDAKVHFWGRPEVEELPRILVPGEKIMACLNGYYEGGLAMLCATDQRILLIDKKVFHLTVEDLQYDMISEVDYGAQLISGTVRIRTPGKTLTFTALRPKILRDLVSFIQQRLIEIRQQHNGQRQSQESQTWEQQNAQPVQYVRLNTPQAPFIDPTAIAAQEWPQATAITPEQQVLQRQAAATPTSFTEPIRRRNPYASLPFMTRRRVGRFDPVISTASLKR